ncbi:tRNA (guanine-N(7)-)-methyltransferase non-catalytic subunit trm82, partial [Coemansia sp. 'formosensis']
LHIYETTGWTTARRLQSEKRSNALTFEPSGEYLITADKFGDAHWVGTTSEYPETSKVLLGHVSNLCAVDFSFHEKPYVLTCDRDEKLRVSKYPNSYNIQAFGLGHTEFITSVAPARFALDNAVTGSGDGSMRLWNMHTGELLQTVEMSTYLAKYYESGAALCTENTYEDRTAAIRRYGVLRVRAIDAIDAFVAVVERIPAVLVFPFRHGKLAEPQVIDIAHPPTDVGVLGDRLVVSYAPTASGELLTVLKHDGDGYVADEELAAAFSANVTTLETEDVPKVQSIFVWGNKMYLERPKGEDADDQ